MITNCTYTRLEATGPALRTRYRKLCLKHEAKGHILTLELAAVSLSDSGMWNAALNSAVASNLYLHGLIANGLADDIFRNLQHPKRTFFRFGSFYYGLCNFDHELRLN